MVDIVCGFLKFNGAVTSLIDTYFNLKNYTDINFNLICNPRYQKEFIRSSAECPKIDFKILKNNKFNILITSADFIGQFYSIFKNFKYNKIIILDSYKIYIDFYKNNNFTADTINNLKTNYYILGNYFNKKYFNKNYYLYYHKFSEKRLNYLKEKYKNKTGNLKRDEESIHNLHEYSSYYYERFHTCDGTTYIENIGKLLFEYRYFGKDVYYSSKNKTINDGLTEYLSLFNIDDSYSQNLLITNEDIKDNLFMKQTDLILEIINDR